MLTQHITGYHKKYALRLWYESGFGSCQAGVLPLHPCMTPPTLVLCGLAAAGYPGDKPYGSFYKISPEACKVNDTDGQNVFLEHKCDVYAGQSGSPMWDVEVGGTRQASSR